MLRSKPCGVSGASAAITWPAAASCLRAWWVASSDLTRTRNSSRCNGLEKKSSAPACNPLMRSSRFLVEVRKTTPVRGVGGIGLDALADFEAGHALHHQVEHHQLR